MKNFKTTLIYALLAALLGGYIYFFESGPVKKKDEEKKLKVFENFVADDISQIHLENLGTTVTAEKSPVELQKDEKGVWQITSPKKLRADESVVRNLLSSVGDFNPDSSIENPTNLADFGLKNPSLKSRFKTKSGAAYELIVGDKNAAGTSNYVQAAGKGALYLLPSGSIDLFKKNVDDFRDHSVMKTDLVVAKKVRVTRDGKVFEFEKDKDNVWNITEPIEEKAEESKVRDLLNSVNGLRIDGFVKDNPSSLGPYGLAKPHVKVEVWPADGGPSKALLLGHKREKFPSYYAKTSDLPAVYYVSDFIEKTMDLKLSEFRDKSVMKFDAGAVKAITVKRGAKTWVYQKGDKSQWTAEGRLGANEEGANLVSLLSSTTIADFAAKGASTGLSQPSYTAEVLLNDKSVRKFRFGKMEKGQVYLASDKTKDVYLVPSGVVSQMENYFSAVLTPVPAVTPITATKK